MKTLSEKLADYVSSENQFIELIRSHKDEECFDALREIANESINQAREELKLRIADELCDAGGFKKKSK